MWWTQPGNLRTSYVVGIASYYESEYLGPCLHIEHLQDVTVKGLKTTDGGTVADGLISVF
jgi:hypothetical protein